MTAAGHCLRAMLRDEDSEEAQVGSELVAEFMAVVVAAITKS